jgi:hypothetical protein
MNLQEIAKRKNFYNDLSYYFKWLSSLLFLIGFFDHKDKKEMVIAAGFCMGLSLFCYCWYVHFRKLEGA